MNLVNEETNEKDEHVFSTLHKNSKPILTDIKCHEDSCGVFVCLFVFFSTEVLHGSM